MLPKKVITKYEKCQLFQSNCEIQKQNHCLFEKLINKIIIFAALQIRHNEY